MPVERYSVKTAFDGLWLDYHAACVAPESLVAFPDTTGGRLGVLPEHYLKGPSGDPPPYDLDYGFDLSKEDEEEDDDGDDEL